MTAAAASSPEAVPHKAMITLSVMLATVMQVIDTTIANVALPHMQGSLAATQDQIAWILTSYIVASAIMTPTTGWLAGRFGRKKIFLIAVTGFTVASALCGIATSIGEMVFFRLLQGVFGAALVPLSQSTLLDINPREKHASAMALWGVGVMIGPILGPTLGGYLTEYYDWRWIFYINVPFGILAFLGISAFLPDTPRLTKPFDTMGFILLALVIGGFQLLLDRGEQADWFSSAEILLYAGIVVSAIWMFAVHVRFVKHPFISISMFRDRNLSTGLVFIFFIGIILLATMALLPPFMQNLMGYPVVDVGLIMAPRGVGTAISMIIVGRLANKVDTRFMILIGLSLTAFSLYQMTQFSSFVPAAMIVRSGFVQGLGLGLVFASLSTVTFATIDPQYRTEAAGMFSLVRNIGSSVGVSLMTVLLSRNIQINHASLSENITPYRTGLAQYFMPQVAASSPTAVLSMVNAEVTRQAATISYLNDFKLMMIVVICVMPLVFFLNKPVRRNAAKDEPAMIAE